MLSPPARGQHSTTSRLLLLFMGAVFLCTGATALLVEQVFEKLLTTVVGSATPAGAVVLSVYFAGLSLGGLLYGALRSRFRSPILLYALLESVVGAYAIGLSLLSSRAQDLSARVIHLGGDSGIAVFILRLAVACVWILPPVTAMGATFASVVGVLRLSGVKRVPLAMARFYALNLAGAIAGAALGPYLFFPRFGLTGTLRLVAAVQLAVVISAVLWGHALARTSAGAPSQAAHKEPGALRSFSRLLAAPEGRLLAALSFTSGFVLFALEVLWIHLIGVVLGMSVYAFALMLTAVLGGLFVGSLLVSAMASRGTREGLDWLLPLSFGLGSALLAATFGLWDDVPLWLLKHGRTVFEFAEAERLKFWVALLLVGAPSLALGMVYPSLFRSSFFPQERADLAAGQLSAVNAIGSILGALGSAFLLIPLLGSEQTFRWMTTIPGLAGAAIAFRLLRRHWRAPGARFKAALGLCSVSLFAAGSILVVRSARWNALELTSGINVYFMQSFVTAGSKLVFWHEDTAGGITTVIETTVGGATTRTLLTNGKFQGNDTGEATAQAALAVLPCMATRGRNRALVIGLGTGHSARVVADSGFAHTEIAEIAPGIVQAAREQFGHMNHSVLDDPRVQVHVEDGRNHLLRSRRHYDLISMELSSVWFAGVANLYSLEFYELASRRLAQGGVLQQWIQLHHIAPEEAVSVLRTMRAVFAHAGLWLIGQQGILLASRDPIRFSGEAVAALREQPRMGPLLDGLARDFPSPVVWAESRVVFDGDDATRMLELFGSSATPIATDANRFLEYATPRHNVESGRSLEATMWGLMEFVSPAARASRARALGIAR